MEDAQRFADIAKRLHERVDEVHVRERAHGPCQHEQRRVRAIDAEQDVDAADHLRLQQRQDDEQHPTAEVALAGRGLGKARDFDFHERDQDKAADPQGQVRVKRGHARAVVRNGENLLGDHLHGRGDERAHPVRLDIEQFRELVNVDRFPYCADIGDRVLQVDANGVEEVLRV